MSDSYRKFLEQKVAFHYQRGHKIDPDEIHPILFPHQSAIVRWAVQGGQRAIFAAFGLGKTLIQLETVRLTLAHAGGGRGLIVCPLGVRQEFAHDAGMLGITARFIRRTDEIDGDGIYLTNYESIRDGRLDPADFTAISLDEASCLRSYGSKTFWQFLDKCSTIPYRFVATATPSPNRYKELIHYAGFLGIMDTGQALTRFFQRDSTKANNLTLYPHKEHEFWLWLSSWSIFLQNPSDIGFSDDGYTLPPLNVVTHEVEVDHMAMIHVETNGQSIMFRGDSPSAIGAAREKRATMTDRIAKVMSIIDGWRTTGDADQCVIWCDLNAEQTAIERALRTEGLTFSSIYGSLTTEEAERRLEQWRNRETFALIAKPVMLGSGVNLQQTNKAIYAGITYKFNDMIQSLHRIQRFGQTRPCTAHIIFAESEREVFRTLMHKWDNHKELTATMTEIIKEHGLNDLSVADALTRSMGVERIEIGGKNWTAVNNDCVDETGRMDPDSVDMIITSIPFANHYEYTPSYNDFGHTDNNDHFWSQMDYLTPSLLKILRPGRIYACHVKDRILFGNVTGTGTPTVSPFHAEALMHGIRHGFDYLGMITVTTDVVRENNQSYRLGYGEMRKDGTKMGVGSPEYILLFRKPQSDRSRGYADVPVVHRPENYSLARWQVDAHAYWRSSGDRALTVGDLGGLDSTALYRIFTDRTLDTIYSYEAHVKIGDELSKTGTLPKTFMLLNPGSPDDAVWHDVNRMLTLNTEQSRRAEQMHVCPLQFDIVDRLIERYSNPGDLIFDPFGGLSTVGFRALKLGRAGYTVELNHQYYLDGVRYLQAEEARLAMPTLFDLRDLEAPQAEAVA